MRVGINPEKFKGEKNRRYFHRIIIPVYIPNNDEDFYEQSIDVLDACINSLTKTINYSTTAITLINNNSHSLLIKPIIEKYNLQIDKIVNYNENKGKVYAVVSEAKSSYEPFITIADADILFFGGWESAVFEIFNNFKKAGVVSPLPVQSLAFNKNCSIFFDNYFFCKIKYGRIVSDKDNELYLKGLGNQSSLDRNNRKYSWKEKQYYIENDVIAILGATHFCATYKRATFNFDLEFPELKFVNGYEDAYLDEPADRKGWYRLSTSKTYAYHIGNKMDEFAVNKKFDSKLVLNPKIFDEIDSTSKSIIPYGLKFVFFRFIKKIMRL